MIPLASNLAPNQLKFCISKYLTCTKQVSTKCCLMNKYICRSNQTQM